MATWNLKNVINVYGDRLLVIVTDEEKKHGAGALVLSIKEGLDVAHVSHKTFEGQPEIYNSITKCTKDGDVFCIFHPKNGKQEIGVLSRRRQMPSKDEIEDLD